MRAVIRLALFALAAVLLAGCAAGPPTRPVPLAALRPSPRAPCAAVPPKATVQLPALRLAPAALGHELAAQQKLHFTFGAHERDLDALLEVDAQQVRLAVQAMGQSGVTLRWDGQSLQEQRAPWLPPSVRGERVLDDLQFTLWPADAVRAALPGGWMLFDDGVQRRLSRDGVDWLVMERTGEGSYRLDNPAEGYSLSIESLSIEPAPEGQ